MPDVLLRWVIPVVVLVSAVACSLGARKPVTVSVTPTATLRPTFTATVPTATPTETATSTPTALPPNETPAPTFTPTLTVTPVAPTAMPVPPTATSLPPTPTATQAPTADATASHLRFVLAGTDRKLNCSEVAVYGTVLDANNQPLPGVRIEVVGIHGTQGRHEGIVGADGAYAVWLAPLSDLPRSEWYVAVVEGDEEVSERFHWTATANCHSSDSGDSQVLWVHWKLIE